MFKVVSKNSGLGYGILDTSDKSVDYCSLQEIKSYISSGIKIQGVLSISNNLSVHRVMPDILKGFKCKGERNDLGTFVTEIAIEENSVPIVLSGFRQCNDNRKVYAQSMGKQKEFRVVAIEEYPVGGSSRDTYLTISYLAVFDKDNKVACYYNDNALDSYARTRCNAVSSRAYIDLYSRKNNQYAAGVFQVGSLMEQLVSIFVLDSRQLMFVTSMCYESKDDDGEFSVPVYTVYSYNPYTGETSKVDTFRYGDVLSMDSPKAIYGWNCGVSIDKPRRNLSDFVDDFEA